MKQKSTSIEGATLWLSLTVPTNGKIIAKDVYGDKLAAALVEAKSTSNQ